MNFKNWSLKTKIITPTFCLVALILTASTLIMTEQTEKLAIKQAEESADNIAQGYGNKISETLGKALTTTRTLAAMLEMGTNYPTVPDREFFDSVLLKNLKMHPALAGTSCAFLPGTFDGKEDSYMDKYKGVYRSWFYRSGGTIVKTMAGAEGFQDAGWFKKPMAGNVETITEPYEWETGGKKEWYCSTGFPIKKNGKISALSV